MATFPEHHFGQLRSPSNSGAGVRGKGKRKMKGQAKKRGQDSLFCGNRCPKPVFEFLRGLLDRRSHTQEAENGITTCCQPSFATRFWIGTRYMRAKCPTCGSRRHGGDEDAKSAWAACVGVWASVMHGHWRPHSIQSCTGVFWPRFKPTVKCWQ